jgi:hypothetical protein
MRIGNALSGAASQREEQTEAVLNSQIEKPAAGVGVQAHGRGPEYVISVSEKKEKIQMFQ